MKKAKTKSDMLHDAHCTLLQVDAILMLVNNADEMIDEVRDRMPLCVDVAGRLVREALDVLGTAEVMR